MATLTACGGDGEEAAAPAASSTTTTTAVATAEIVDGPESGDAVLVAASAGDDVARIALLDGSTVEETIDVPPVVDDVVLGVGGGFVWSDGATARFVDRSMATREVGPATAVLSAVEPDRFWSVHAGDTVERGADGVETSRAPVPQGDDVQREVADGLLVDRDGSLLVLLAGGGERLVYEGDFDIEVDASSAGHVVTRAATLVDVTSGQVRALPREGWAIDAPTMLASFSADGARLALATGPSNVRPASVAIFDVATASLLTDVSIDGAEDFASLAWSPGNEVVYLLETDATKARSRQVLGVRVDGTVTTVATFADGTAYSALAVAA
ncbi:MAG TPA: hypothetical protein VEA78_12440 [Acidimicrobiales bacterium]|nr:hypothetical protein [Acidimicrobiales bacterium]